MTNATVFTRRFSAFFRREWREKQSVIIAEKDERSEAKRQQTIGAAHEAIDRFYEDYNQKKAKSITENRYATHLVMSFVDRLLKEHDH